MAMAELSYGLCVLHPENEEVSIAVVGWGVVSSRSPLAMELTKIICNLEEGLSNELMICDALPCEMQLVKMA